MPQLIRHDVVVEDDWIVVAADASLADLPPDARVIVPVALWQKERRALLRRGDVGVWLAATDEPDSVAADLAHLPVIAVDFPKFGDGRGFSIARLLRDRHGYIGELRAIGDVFRDQLFFMRECGFDAFAVRPDLDAQKELAGLHAFDRTYAHSARTPRPWFRERTA